jgi:hypothetical protein
MTVSTIGRAQGARFAVVVALVLAAAAVCACGSPTGGGYGSGSGTDSGGSGGSGSSGGGLGNGVIPVGDGGIGFGCVNCKDATVDTGADTGTTSSSGGTVFTPMPAMGGMPAPDCAGCTFPPANAPACASNAPAIKIAYPNDNVLVPPNMNVISVHWTPFGPPFSKYSVDFSSTPLVDWHIVTKCANQTIDVQSGAPSGGCEVVVDPVSWSKLVGAARGQGPIMITVRGTTDGTCATSSTNQIHMSFAEEDLLGTYYYWKSTVSANGVGGQIWRKTFGDLVNPEVDVTVAAIQTVTCNGCHSLSRDGSRMVVYSDDDDSDDEYNDVAGSLLDMTTMPNATQFATPNPNPISGCTSPPCPTANRANQPPGFSAINPLAEYYVTSNGGGAAFVPGISSYPGPVPSNGFSLWSARKGTFVGGVTIGDPAARPTMPDWSVDGKQVVYVVPAGEYTAWRTDDAHIYGGSLYTVPYTGMGTFGAPTLFLKSNGENNYYPSYSPDVPTSYIIFNRVDNMGKGAACVGGFCPDDSFSNPAARLMLIGASAPNGTPIDLEKANGSPVVMKVPWSNSYPRWAPFVQTYQGQKLLWFTFSSTRDYGVRVLNHKNGMYQCYPASSAESGGSLMLPFKPQCQEPQLWMAPINLSEAHGNTDPSRVAFWLPHQDITTHNHTAQWTEQHQPPPPPPPDAGVPPCMCSMVYGPCGAANRGCDCCAGQSLVCSGNNTCISPPH